MQCPYMTAGARSEIGLGLERLPVIVVPLGMASVEVLEKPAQIEKQTRNKGGNPAWVKGVSGNPNGRPVVGDSLAEQVRAILHQSVSKTAKRTNLEAILAKAVTQAKKGDYRAREFLANRGFGMAEQRIKQDVTKTKVVVLE